MWMRLRKGKRGGGGEGGWWDGRLIARGNATYYNNISATKQKCHKSRFSNGFIDNSINVSINISGTSFCHTNSSRRIFWCVCQLLVVAQKLNLMNSIKSLEYIRLLFQHHPRNRKMSNLQQKTTTVSTL